MLRSRYGHPFYCILVALLFSCSTLAQQERYVVRENVSPCLVVRDKPSTGGKRIDCITPGTSVNVIQSAPFWREVEYGNKRGWIAKKYIELPGGPPGAAEDSVVIPADAFLKIHFIDVGQGDAIWIQTYDDGIDGNGKFEGYSIVIDGGPNSSDHTNKLLPYMEKQGYHGADIECLLVTHPHDDHYSGAETIARHFSVNHYYDPAYPNTTPGYKAFLKYMAGSSGSSAHAQSLHLGEANFGKLNWGKEMQVEILYSWRGDPHDELGSGSTELNNASIVLRVQYGDHVFLFMGDAEGKERKDDAANAGYVEKILLETVPAKLKATVLKIAHHGSETSSTLPFIQAVDPDIVVIQSGRKTFSGRYLPDLTTLQRYCTHNPRVKIYRTDLGDKEAGYSGAQAADGDHILIQTNGKGKPKVEALQGGRVTTTTFCDQ